MRPTDLRGILRYVPQFREKTFVIAVDGAIVDDDNFGNILIGFLSCRFTLGGQASVAAGPVGRTSSAQTDAFMTAEIVSWSRSRGVFAGTPVPDAAAGLMAVWDKYSGRR